jgi:hypothetical protein
MKKMLWLIPVFLFLAAISHAQTEVCDTTEVDTVIATYPETKDIFAFEGNCDAMSCAQSTDKMCRFPTCSDTDGGIVPETQGTVSGRIYIFGFPHDYSATDFCLPCPDDKLVEWYCENGDCGGEVPKFTVVTCELGCERGACKEPEVPEFGLVAAGVAVAGAVAGFFFLRKK